MHSSRNRRRSAAPARMRERSSGQKRTVCKIPESAPAGATIHLVLEVYDDNPIVSLKSYRRIVLTVG